MNSIGETIVSRNNKIGDALRAARGDRSIEALAKELDVNKNTLGDYERGVRAPEIDFLVRFAAITGADLSRLMALRLEGAGVSGHDDAILTALTFMAKGNPTVWRDATIAAGLAGEEWRARESIAAYESLSSDYVLIKRRGLLGAAGSAGAENVVVEERGALAFRRDWMLKKGVTNPDSLIVADIQGDSMEPTLFDSDTALFNSLRTNISDAIYLFCLEGRMFVKRLRWKGAVIEVISDNRDKYPPFEISDKEAEAQHFKVLGEFFWRGGDRLQ